MLGRMSGAWSGNSRAAKWVLCLLAVPLIYLVTAPPIVHGARYFSTVHGKPIPQWSNAYAAPYQWMKENTPLGGVLNTYNCWWLSKVIQLLYPPSAGKVNPLDVRGPVLEK